MAPAGDATQGTEVDADDEERVELPSDDEADCALVHAEDDESAEEDDDELCDEEDEEGACGEDGLADASASTGQEAEGVQGQGDSEAAMPARHGEVEPGEVAAHAKFMEDVGASDVAKLRKPELMFHLRARGLPAPANRKRAGHAAALLQALGELVPVDSTFIEAHIRAMRVTSGAPSVGGASAAAEDTSGAGVARRRGQKDKAKKKEWKWQPVDPSMISRPVYAGASHAYVPSDSVGLRSSAHPFRWFEKFMTKPYRMELVTNSNKYKGWLLASGIEAYMNAKPITLLDVDLFFSMLFLNGLNPVPAYRDVHSKSWARKGVRAADLLTRDRWVEMRALFHISSPREAPAPGSDRWDVLHKVRPMIDHVLKNSRANVIPSKAFAIDEMTIGFQGHHGTLKQRCHRYKRAGDGFQADALCLDGGYLLAVAFRGDNTVPAYNPEFSTLHNRCLHILQHISEDGSHLFWDNLYPSLDVVQALAAGAEYTAVHPGGTEHGKSVTITVPKILSAGTARVNRGVPQECRQPEKAKMSKKQMEELAALKQSNPEQVMKSLMTVTEPRVLCISYFDQAPVHMFTTIHTEPRFVDVSYPRWNAELGDNVTVRGKRAECIDDYNHNMNNVDRFDQVGKAYNLDGMGWRDRKWWHPIFKAFLKAAADQAYLLYRRQFEIEQATLAQAAEALARATEGSPSGNTRRRSAQGEVLGRQRKKVAMQHSVFLEKVSEGLFISGFNSSRPDRDDHINLDDYCVQDLLNAIDALRGRGRSRAVKRQRSAYADEQLIPLPFDRSRHLITSVPEAVGKTRYCGMGVWCPKAAENKATQSHRHQQQGRAKAAKGVWCTGCRRHYHAECFSIYHRDAIAWSELRVPERDYDCQHGRRVHPHRRASSASTSSGASSSVARAHRSSTCPPARQARGQTSSGSTSTRSVEGETHSDNVPEESFELGRGSHSPVSASDASLLMSFW